MFREYIRRLQPNSPKGNWIGQKGNSIMKLELDDKEKLKICDDIFDILNHGGEVIIRKRSKNGEKYLEIAEQKTTLKSKMITANKI